MITPLDYNLKGYRSFRVTGDIRVIYENLGNSYYLIDYGTTIKFINKNIVL